jgi:hypothetical protein
VKVGGDLMEAIKGTDLREYLPENEAHGIWGAVQYNVPSAMKVGGDLMDAIKGTDLRECSPEYDAHVVGGAVSALSVVKLGGERGGDEVVALTRHKFQLQGRRREGSEARRSRINILKEYKSRSFKSLRYFEDHCGQKKIKAYFKMATH